MTGLNSLSTAERITGSTENVFKETYMSEFLDLPEDHSEAA